MKQIFRMLQLVIPALVLCVALVGVVSQDASAATHTPTGNQVSQSASIPQASCFGAKSHFGSFTLKKGVYLWGNFVTTSRCRDINMLFTTLKPGAIDVQVCFLRTNQCNAWKTYHNTNTWYTPATNVVDGTRYRFGFRVQRTTTFQGFIAD